MKFQPVSQQSTVDEVVEQIRNLLEQGKLAPGARLPSELELVKQFRVSRTVVREAVTQLETIGLVTVQRGRGMFVGDRRSLVSCVKLVRSAMAIAPKELLQFVEFRRIVECYAARRAAVLASPQDLADLESLCEQIDREGQGDLDSACCDLQFHLKIVELTGNHLLRGVMEVVQELILAAMVQATSQPRDRQQSRCRHRAVLEAIRAGDPDAAEKAMQEHIECTMQHLEAIHRQQQRNPA